MRPQPKPAGQNQAWPLKRKPASWSATRFIRALHRGENSYITFHRKHGDDFKNLFSVRPPSLDKFSVRLSSLRADSYFSINGFWRRELEKKNPKGLIKGVSSRRVKHVQFLNAAYSDIDCYTPSLHLDLDSAFAKIGHLIASDKIPPPSCGLVSRGVWLFWLLRDEDDPTRPPRGNPHVRDVYRNVMRAILDVLAPVGADSRSIDAARMTRIPGSINTKRGVKVQALWPGRGDPPIYTLTELCRYLHVERVSATHIRKHTAPAVVGDLPSGKKPGNSNGWARVNAQRLRQFRALEKMRGGFKDGCRNHAALIYAQLLTAPSLTSITAATPDDPSTGTYKKQVAERVARFGKRCAPPLTDSEIQGALRSGTNKLRSRNSRGSGSITNKTISEWLEITMEEHKALKKQFGRYAWRPSPTHSIRPVDDRRNAMNKIFTAMEESIPSIRQVVRLLKKGDPSFSVSPAQVAKDYKALGLVRRSGRWVVMESNSALKGVARPREPLLTSLPAL